MSLAVTAKPLVCTQPTSHLPISHGDLLNENKK
jgi:hypothetical protein